MDQDAVQQLEHSAKLRIKFASVNKMGVLEADSGEEYQQFFQDIAAETSDWNQDAIFQINTRSEYLKNAHVLSTSDVKIAAIEHETGLELIASSVAINLASSAISGFAKWGWEKWKNIRDLLCTQGANKLDPSLQLEGVKSQDTNGEPKQIIRIEYRPPLDSVTIARYVDEFAKSLSEHSQSSATDINTREAVSLTFNFNFNA